MKTVFKGRSVGMTAGVVEQAAKSHFAFEQTGGEMKVISTPEQWAEYFGVSLAMARDVFREFDRRTVSGFRMPGGPFCPKETNDEQLDRLRKLLVFTPTESAWPSTAGDDIVRDLAKLVEVLKWPMRVVPNYVRIGDREFVDGVEVSK